MARSANTSRPGRSLTWMGVITVLLFGSILASVQWSDGQLTPKLGLDLEGGYQIVLEPKADGVNAQPSEDQLRQAVEIIRQRVDASGTSEAEVTTEGGRNIVVAIPGKVDPKIVDRVKASSKMEFRPVLRAAPGSAQPEPAPSPTSTASPSSSPSGSATPTPSASATLKGASPSASASSNGMALPKAVQRALNPLKAATATPTQGSATASPTQTPSVSLPDTPTVSPSNASDDNWITPAVAEAFTKLDCAASDLAAGGFQTAPNKAIVACDRAAGGEKYILGPVELDGTAIDDASWGQEVNSQGAATGGWEVRLKFTSDGGKQFAAITERLVTYLTSDPTRNRFAIVLDGLVISAPSTNERIGAGEAQITGDFTQREASALAQQIKFGALPVSFEVKTTETVSALLGKEQLERGLLAGLIGMLLVVVYSLLQYRALGFVTVASLVVVGVITYGLVTLLGWRQGYRLTLPGVAGMIVSIGVTADSFIVYFERIRDEVREGKPLAVAVEVAWQRARRTILASDAVNFLAAAVLYLLAVGGVRGFAFTLGLTTIVDVVVVFLFTKPIVTLLSRTHFFGGGHKLSGFDAAHLGRSVAYAGRGRVRMPSSTPAKKSSAAPATGETIAQRRAAQRKAAEQGPQDTTDDAGRSAEAAGTGRDL